jgi:trehalose monomycolate/heme transporter
MMRTWGALVARRAWTVLAVGLALAVAAAVFGLGVFGSLGNGGFEDPASESARALAREHATFRSHDADIVVIYSSPSMTVGDPAFRKSVSDVITGLPAGSIQRVTSWYESPSPTLVSKDRHTTRVILALSGTSQGEKEALYEQVSPHLDARGLTTTVGGLWAVSADVNSAVARDAKRAEIISLPIVVLLCLVFFGSVTSALMPAFIGGVAIFGGFALVRLLTMVTDVSIYSINIITLIGMGLAIDYALFVVSRFREELARAPDTGRKQVNEAITVTMATAGRTVLFSGLIVAASLASLLVFEQSFLRSMGYGGVAAVLVAMLAALTLLPALLTVLGPRIEAGRMPWRRHPRAAAPAESGAASAGHQRDGERGDGERGDGERGDGERGEPASRRGDIGEESGAWAALAHSVMRRPVAYLLVITVVLLTLGAPFLSVRWGSTDERVLPASAPSRLAADLGARRFGGPNASANIVVEGAGRPQLEAYVARLAAVSGVQSARVIDQAAGGAAGAGPASLVQVGWPGHSQSKTSQQLVRDLRAVEPGSVATGATGATALVGGATASAVDLIDSIGARLPWMGAFVVVVMLVLLFVAFGSVVLPLKAVVMNALSLTASFGVVTLIFQDGYLSGPLRFTSTGFLDVTQPILMLAIIFGLSMDYEVFLLSRIREEWDRTGDNTRAVASGLQRSGRIITSAAVLLAVVIGGFTTSDIVLMKMIGVGMLVAVLIDATVVRALLVPATMRLLGTVNWWAPGPLRRWWERHALPEHGSGEHGPREPRLPVPKGADAAG